MLCEQSKKINYQEAFFVFYPHRLQELRRPHSTEQRKQYVVVKRIKLGKVDYENFSADLCVDRWFIEENAAMCRVDENGLWHSILVQQRGKTDGILVMSDGHYFPQWAAYIPETSV